MLSEITQPPLGRPAVCVFGTAQHPNTHRWRSARWFDSTPTLYEKAGIRAPSDRYTPLEQPAVCFLPLLNTHTHVAGGLRDDLIPRRPPACMVKQVWCSASDNSTSLGQPTVDILAAAGVDRLMCFGPVRTHTHTQVLGATSERFQWFHKNVTTTTK